MSRMKLLFCNKIIRRSLLVGSAVITPSIVQNTGTLENSLITTKEDTGWDRLEKMYSYDQWGELSKEMNAVLQTTLMSGLVGVVYGGFKYSQEAYLDFMERNQATKFTSHLEAKRRLQNHVTINFGRGAFKYAGKLSVFCGTFVLVLTSASVYHGHTSVFHYIFGGIFAGALYQFKVGPRGMVVGATLGGVLGLIGGSFSQLLLSLTGGSLEDVIIWQNQFDGRKAQMHIMERKKAETEIGGEKTELMAFHTKLHEKKTKDENTP